MTIDRIALISDVHGNLTALQAVLGDIAARGITRIVNLGDFIGKGPRGQQAADLCREVCEVNLRGNWEDFLPAEQPTYRDPSLWWWREELRAEQLPWLRTLPLSHDLLVGGRRVRLLHASAGDVHTKVYADLSPVEFDGMFAATALTGSGPVPTVVGYGDIHDAYLSVRDGRTLFNVGSVGNALDEPIPSYAVLEGAVGSDLPGPFGLQFVRVPYDVEAEIQVAADVGMPGLSFWATELRTGVYRSLQPGWPS
ncbi:metallophosphoesterase family protein [Allobranchiibius sp. GilTou38]|uniref:metallophosphoesterase family protein n=1 Tax=Allobranchiibius sp. GilTou38 TaxID=2815210 RepID=UPI00325FEB9F